MMFLVQECVDMKGEMMKNYAIVKIIPVNIFFSFWTIQHEYKRTLRPNQDQRLLHSKSQNEILRN